MGNFVRQLACHLRKPLVGQVAECAQIDFVELALAATIGIPEGPLPPFFWAGGERHVCLVVEPGRVGQPRPPGGTSHPQTGVLVMSIPSQARNEMRFQHTHEKIYTHSPLVMHIARGDHFFAFTLESACFFALTMEKPGSKTGFQRPDRHPFSRISFRAYVGIDTSFVYNTPDKTRGVFLLDFLGIFIPYKLPNALKYSCAGVTRKAIYPLFCLTCIWQALFSPRP